MGKSQRKPKLAKIEVNGRLLNRPQVEMLRQASVAEFERRPRDARALYAELERQLGAATERDWLKAAAAEIVALEAMRGGMAEVSDRPEHKGRVRILSRDGLERLRDADSITANEYAAGIRYRDRFEMAQASLRSCMGGGVGGQPKSAGGIDKRADAIDQLRKWDEAIFASFSVARHGHDALYAVREVAGAGRSIRELSTSGRRRGELSARLRDALGLLGEMMSLH